MAKKMKKAKLAKGAKLAKVKTKTKKVKSGFGIKDVPTKSAVHAMIAEHLKNDYDAITNKLVKDVLITYGKIVTESVDKADKANLHDLGIIVTKKIKPAQKGGQKKKNPFTGETYITKSKPKSAALKARFAKWLKESITA